MEKTGSGITTKIRNWIIRQRRRGKPRGNIVVVQRMCCLCGEKFIVRIGRREMKHNCEICGAEYECKLPICDCPKKYGLCKECSKKKERLKRIENAIHREKI